MKYLGIFLIIGGIGGIISEEFVPGIVLLVVGILVFNKFRKPKSKPISSNGSNKKITKGQFKFRVAGVTKPNDKGKNIQTLIRELVDQEIEMNDYSYDDMTDKEIIDFGRDVYETDLNGNNEIELVFEPDNRYDTNAIKVIHEDIGHIGYVSKQDTAKVKQLLDKGCHIAWNLLGGNVKYTDDNKVKTKTLTYGIEITLSN